MRSLSLLLLTAVSLLSLPIDGYAQQRPKVKIDRVQVGFPVNPQLGEFKSGFWTPIYVDVTAGPEGVVKGDVLVETADGDDVRNSYRVPLPPLEPNEMTTVLTYTKPSSLHAEIIVSVRVDNREYTHKESYSSIPLGEVLYVTVGSRLLGLRRAFVQAPSNQDADEDVFTKGTGRNHFGALDDVRQMPTRWYGYDPVDVLILTTGNRDFLNALVSDGQNRREALAEWVSRGGHLVMSVSKNQDILASLDSTPGMLGLLPAALAGTIQRPRLDLGPFAGNIQNAILENPLPRNNPEGPRPPLEIAKLEPKPARDLQRLLPGDPRPEDPLLIVRGAYGLGQVTLIAFDVDLPPFTTWKGQPAFWKVLGTQLGTYDTSQKQPGSQPSYAYPGNPNEDVASQFARNLEQFPDVPVISFGWVALFILIYILVVGPLDYFFLKKVVKRLELTWITFPTVVIVISVASYFIAYYLKGNDQLINKVDLVDVDLHGQQVYGHTWFTVFSPRIQHYTIGVEPAEPGWVPAAGTNAPNRNSSVLVSWMSRPEAGWGGSGRAHSQSLFRRTYEYAPNATGLTGVPIQVWTTKSFVSDWRAPLDPARPLFQSDIHHPVGRPDALSGTLTSNLPIELEDAALLYRGREYALDRLLPGIPKRVDNAVTGQSWDVKTWINSTFAASSPKPNQPYHPGMPNEPTYTLVKRLEFFDHSQPGKMRNYSLGQLDQSWRLNHRDELIVAGRVARKEGPAEDVTTDPASASQLWLGQLPSSGQPRPTIPGTLTQETYVRVLIPVRERAP